MDFLKDDKSLVIVAVLILGLGVLCKSTLDPEAAKLMANLFAGLFGVAVGRATS